MTWRSSQVADLGPGSKPRLAGNQSDISLDVKKMGNFWPHEYSHWMSLECWAASDSGQICGRSQSSPRRRDQLSMGCWAISTMVELLEYCDLWDDVFIYFLFLFLMFYFVGFIVIFLFGCFMVVLFLWGDMLYLWPYNSSFCFGDYALFLLRLLKQC